MTNSQAHSSYDDEIDLIELIQNLWRKKWLIILCGLLGVVLAVAYALMAKEVWKSTAQVTEPNSQLVKEYLSEERRFITITDENSLNDSEKVKKFTQETIEEIFKEFMYTAANSVEKKEFLEQSDYYQSLKEDDEQANQKKLAELIKNLNVQVPDEKAKTVRQYYTLSFEADNPMTAQETLMQYIEASNKKTIEQLMNNLKAEIDTNIQWREDELKKLVYDLKSKQTEDLKTYEDALNKASLAGIKEFFLARDEANATNNKVEIFQSEKGFDLYLQGEKILTALVQATKEADLIYPKKYYQYQYELEQLQALKLNIKEIKTFEYQTAPEYPLNREKPKRSLIVIIGGLVGGILGVFWALLTTAFENRRKQHI